MRGVRLLLLCVFACAFPASAPAARGQSAAEGVAIFDARTLLPELIAAKRFAEAESLATRVVHALPGDGEGWQLLARAKAGLGRPVEAGQAFERAANVGGPTTERALYNAAIFYYAAGERELALRALREQIFDRGGLDRHSLAGWPQFAGLRADTAFMTLVGVPLGLSPSRDAGWQADLDFLLSEIGRVNPDHRGGRALPSAVTQQYRQLRQDIPRLSDEQIIARISQMLAALAQGHTGVWDLSKPESRVPLKRLPVQFYSFADGVYIVHADSAHQSIVGTRVTRLGSVAMEEALRRLRTATSVDSESEHLFRIYYLQDGALLNGLGIAASMDSVQLDVVASDGKQRSLFLPLRRGTNWFKLPPPPQAVDTPVYLRRVAEAHWDTTFAEIGAAYVQVNQMRNDRDETLAEFGRRLRSRLSEAAISSLIIDLRHNNGGDSNLYRELLRTAVGFSLRPGTQVYALIGRTTYSAAGNFITELERLVDPIFVGEASSECCTLNGDAVFVHLPFSRLEVSVSARKWMLGGPFDHRRSMSPDVPVALTAADYFAGRDPVQDAVEQLIRRRVARP